MSTIREYSRNEIIINSGVLGSGTYGEILTGVIREEPYKKIVLKRFKSYSEKYIIEDFFRELIILKYLNDMGANVVKLYGTLLIKEDDHDIGTLYIIMEKYGSSLHDVIIKPRIKLDKMVYIKLMKNILKSVAFINECGIVHSDLKPANILVDDEYNVKIIDFGLSNFIGIGSLKGNYENYLTTELFKDSFSTHKGYQTDSYAVGIIMYNILSRSYDQIILLQPELYGNDTGPIYLVHKPSFEEYFSNPFEQEIIELMKKDNEIYKNYICSRIDNDFYNILVKMLRSNLIKPYRQYTCTEILQLPYFNDEYYGGAIFPFDTLKHYQYSEIEIENKMYEIAIMDNILMNLLSRDIKLLSIHDEHTKDIKYNYNNLLNTLRASHDLILMNYGNYVFYLDEDDIFSTLINYRNIKNNPFDIGFDETYVYGALSAFSSLNFYSFDVNNFAIKGHSARDILESIIFNPNLEFYPLWTYIQYMSIIIRHHIDLEEYHNTIINIIMNIIVYNQNELTINVWELMLYIIHKIKTAMNLTFDIKGNENIGFVLSDDKIAKYEKIYNDTKNSKLLISSDEDNEYMIF